MRFVLTEKAVRGTVKMLLIAVTLLATGVTSYAMYAGQAQNSLIGALLFILPQALPPVLYWLLFRRIIRTCSSEWQRFGMLIISALLIGFYSIGYLEWIGSINAERGLVFLLWPVIALFVVGLIAVVYFLLSKFWDI